MLEEIYCNGLVGQRLVTVVFTLDQIELQFEDINVHVYTELYFREGHRNILSKMPGWRDALCSCLDKEIAKAFVDEDDLIMEFTTGATLRFSLRPKDITGDCAVRLVVSDLELGHRRE